MDQRLFSEIKDTINRISECTLTDLFTEDNVINYVRSYELIKKSTTEGFVTAKRILDEVKVPLDQLRLIYGFDNSLYQAVCNEIAYTVLLLLNLPLRNLFVETINEEFNQEKHLQILTTLGPAVIVLNRLKSFNIGEKTTVLYNELCEVRDAIMKKIKGKEEEEEEELNIEGAIIINNLQTLFYSLEEALQAGDFNLYKINESTIEYRRILHETTFLEFVLREHNSNCFTLQLFLFRNNNVYVETFPRVVSPGLTFEYYDNTLSGMIKQLAIHFN